MRTFTDDDMKRVKKEIPEGLKGYGFDSMYSFSVEDLQALLARLEAAEKALAIYESSEGDVIMGKNILTEWRKAKGE